MSFTLWVTSKLFKIILKIIFSYLILHLYLSSVYAITILTKHQLCFSHNFIPQIHLTFSLSSASLHMQFILPELLFLLGSLHLPNPYLSLNLRLDCHFSIKFSVTLEDWLVLFHDPITSFIIAHLHCIFRCIFCLLAAYLPCL